MSVVLEKLDYRERHGYTRTIGLASDLEGQQHEVLPNWHCSRKLACVEWGVGVIGIVSPAVCDMISTHVAGASILL